MNFIRLIFELQRNSWKNSIRHPMFDVSLLKKALMYMNYTFLACYFVLGAFYAGDMFEKMRPGYESYEVFNGIFLIIMLAASFLFNNKGISLGQSIKPYTILPIKRKHIISFLVIKTLLDVTNILWFFFLVPFAILNIAPSYGLSGVISYLFGVTLLIIINDLIAQIFINLSSYKKILTIIPVAIYAVLIYVVLKFEDSPLFSLFISFGECLICGQTIAFLSLILLLFASTFILFKVLDKFLDLEISKADDKEKTRAHNFNFLERYKTMGDYIRLELRLILRNKAVSGIYIILILFILGLNCISFFTSYFETRESTINVFIVYTIMYVSTLNILCFPSYEGNYIELIYLNKLDIRRLMQVKYYSMLLISLVVMLALLPLALSDNVKVISIVSNALFIAGFGGFVALRLSVYNKKTMALDKSKGQNKTNSLGAFLYMMLIIPCIIPIAANSSTILYCYGVIGVLFIITSNLWIRYISKIFTKRKYKLIEGMINSRIKK